MKTTLADIYVSKVLVTEKQGLQDSPLQKDSSDQVGNLPKEDVFGETPKLAGEGPKGVKGIETAKAGPAVKQTTGTGTKVDAPKGVNMGNSQAKMPNSKGPAQQTSSKPTEMKGTDVDPTEDEDEGDEKNEKPKNKKPQVKEESFTMSAFETLFKKTINEEFEEETAGDIGDPSLEGEGPNDALDLEDSEAGEDEAGEEEMEEGDLISDLKDLQDKLAEILSKLESSVGENEGGEEDEDYSENDFDQEFGGEEEGGEEEEGVQTESLGKLQALPSSKGHKLRNKNNKVGGKLKKGKGGSAKTGNLKNDPKPKALGDKKGPLMKGTKASSSVTPGDFIK